MALRSLFVKRFFGFEFEWYGDMLVVDNAGRGLLEFDDSDVTAEMMLIAGDAERWCVELDVERE